MLVIAAAGLSAATPARAQSVFEIVFEDAKNVVLDVGAVWTSPFRGGWSDYRTAGLVLGGAGLLLLADEPVADWARDNPNNLLFEALEPFGEEGDPEIEKVAQAPLLDQIPFAFYGIGLIVGSRSLRDGALGCLAAHQAQGMPRHYFYKVVGRERPWVVDGERKKAADESGGRPGDPMQWNVPGESTWYDNSFPGGHTLNIVSCISYLNHRFDLGVAEPVLWTLAFGIAAARIPDQRHWLSDTALGSAIGFAIGRYLAERSLDRLHDDEGEQHGSTRGGLGEPIVAPVRGGALVGWRIKF